MIRHKKEMKQHRLAEFHKKLKELMQRYYAMYKANPALNADKEFFRLREQEIDALEKEYGVNRKNREQMGYYWSRVVHKPIGRINPKHDRARRCHRASTKNGIKPLKKQFNEEIKDYDPDYEAFCAAYGDDNY